MSDSNALQCPWWELEGQEQSSCLIGVVTDCRDRGLDGLRRTLYRVWDALYDGDGLAGLDAGSVDAIALAMGETQFNYSARALDFVHAKLTSETPVVKADGFGASHEQYLNAQRLTRFVRGVSEMLRFETQLPRAMHCALRVGTAGVMADFRDGRPGIEIVHPRELLFDPDDARHGDPACMYRVRTTDRRAALALFPDGEEAIRSAGRLSARGADAYDSMDREDDSVDLVYAWRLGSGDSDPGCHVVCVNSGAPLHVEEWTLDLFPISLLRAWEPQAGGRGWDQGIYGHGLLERLDSAQFTIDELVRHVDESLRYSRLRIFMPDGANVSEADISDRNIGAVIRYSGDGVPSFQNPPVLGPEVMSVLSEWRSSLYQLAGMDESVASSQKPAGVDSGLAMRTYHDFQSQTYVDHMKRYGRLVVDVVERLIGVAAMRCKADPEAAREWRVRYSVGGDAASVISWDDVDVERDGFVMSLEEASPVADSRSGRIQEMEEDAAAGRISQDELVRLREDPDRWWADRCNAKADTDYIDWTIGRLLDTGLPLPMVRDEMDKQAAIGRLRREILVSEMAGRPQEVIDRLEQFSSAVVDSLPPPTPPPAPAMPMSPPDGSMGQPPAPPADFGTVPGPAPGG